LVTQSGLYPYPASSAAWPTLLIHVFCVKFLLGTHCCLVFCLFFLFFGVDFRLLWGQVFSMFCLLLFFSIQNRAWSIKRHFYFCQFFFFFLNLNGQFTSTLRVVILEPHHTYSLPGEMNPERRGSPRQLQSALHGRWQRETLRGRHRWEQVVSLMQSLSVTSLWGAVASVQGVVLKCPCMAPWRLLDFPSNLIQNMANLLARCLIASLGAFPLDHLHTLKPESVASVCRTHLRVHSHV
jgi:hypothetical protein